MGKYKDALIEVSKDCKGYAMERRFGKCACSKSLQLLKELVMEKELKIDLEEVKKEWEELGYECKERNCYIYFDNGEFNFAFFYKTNENNDLDCIEIENHSEEPLIIDGKLLKLLTKTMKALGWFDDENR